MEIVIQENPDTVNKYLARLVAELVRKKPNAVLGLAAGSTQLGLYRELIRMHAQDKLDFGKVVTFNLDEYVGLPRDHACSFHSIMRTTLFDHLNIRSENIHIPNGMAEDIAGECEQYEQKIQKAGGIDLALLGVSEEGHIGFNEPSSSLNSRTRVKMLTEKTRYEYARYFASLAEVPRHVITMGVGTIMDSRRVVLTAFGQRKSEVIAKVVEGPVTAMVPGSALQYHAKVKVVVDEAAAQFLRMKDYYRWAFEHKPKWQGV